MQWQKRTDIELFDEKDLDKLFHIRARYASYQLTSQQIHEYLSHMYLVEQDYGKRFSNYKEGFLDLLEGAKRGWIISNGVVPSSAKTVAETILNLMVQPFLKSALRFYKEENIPMLLMDIDYSFGLVEIPAAIIGASTEEEGGGQGAIDYGMIETLKHYGSLPSKDSDLLYNKVLKSSVYHRTLLEKDTSGKTLVSSIIACLETEDNSHDSEPYHRDILPMHNKTLYRAGSQYGKKAFEGLFDIWQEEKFLYAPQ